MPADQYPRRRERLLESLREAYPGVGPLLVSAETNVRYLTGFTGDSTALLIGPDDCRFVTDTRFAEQIERECPGPDAAVRTAQTDATEYTAEVLRTTGAKAIGFESRHLPWGEVEKLKALVPGLELVPTEGVVETPRRVKDEDEVAEIREAVRTAERVFRSVTAGLSGDDEERTVAHRLESELRRLRAERLSFDAIVARDAAAALPHHRPGDGRLSDARTLLVDWGARLPSGYVSDLTRTGLLTRADRTDDAADDFAEVYAVVNRAVDAALAVLKPGATGRAVDAAARGVIEEAGYGDRFGHGLGHGIGLDVHEGPRLSPTSDDVLAVGMVVTVEPGVYLPGRFGVRIEEDVLVTAGGCEVLSTLPRAEPPRWPL